MDIPIKEEFIKKAKKMHETYPVVDSHLDLAGEVLIRSQIGECDVIHNHYLEHWRRAGIKLIVSSVYVPTKVLQESGVSGAWEDALLQIQVLKSEIEASEELMLIRSKGDLKKVVSGNKIGVLIYMEGLDCIGEDIGRLETLFHMGVRGASLTWSRSNALANGCCKAGEYRQIPGGLTKMGIQAVQELERLSMFLDISHLNDDGFEDVVNVAKKPFLATHSCARDIYDNYRNLTKKQMLLLAQSGGVMGLNGCKLIAGSKEGNHLEMLYKHTKYEADILGAEHVGFGFDLCDSYDRAVYIREHLKGKKENPEQIEQLEKAAEKELEAMDCFNNHSQIILLTAALLQNGITKEKVIQIMGGSLMKYFEKVLPK